MKRLLILGICIVTLSICTLFNSCQEIDWNEQDDYIKIVSDNDWWDEDFNSKEPNSMWTITEKDEDNEINNIYLRAIKINSNTNELSFINLALIDLNKKPKYRLEYRQGNGRDYLSPKKIDYNTTDFIDLNIQLADENDKIRGSIQNIEYIPDNKNEKNENLQIQFQITNKTNSNNNDYFNKKSYEILYSGIKYKLSNSSLTQPVQINYFPDLSLKNHSYFYFNDKFLILKNYRAYNSGKSYDLYIELNGKELGEYTKKANPLTEKHAWAYFSNANDNDSVNGFYISSVTTPAQTEVNFTIDKNNNIESELDLCTVYNEESDSSFCTQLKNYETRINSCTNCKYYEISFSCKNILNASTGVNYDISEGKFLIVYKDSQ